jgi:hypothetical protein
LLSLPSEELYGVRKNPGQINNRADKPEYVHIKQALEKKLLTELRKAGDLRVIGHGKHFDRPPYTDRKFVVCQDTSL